MDKHKISFILCSNNDQYLTECFHYLSQLEIPEGYTIDTLVIPDAVSMAAGYNEGMRASDARIKVYLHQDTFIRHRAFVQDILDIFDSDPAIGMIGMIGARRLCWDGVMWHQRRVGNIYRLDRIKRYEPSNIEVITHGTAEVEVVDGLMMITQYDLPWREDIVTGWDFYDVSQCLEFRRAGYKIVVPGQQSPWYIHDCELPSFWNYEEARKKTIAAYPDFFPAKKSFYFCYSDRIKNKHIAWALVELGYEVRMDTGEVHIENYVERDKDDFAERMKSNRCDYVISFNLSPEIAQACYEEGIPYIAWCYDSPLKELNGWFASYPTTHIFAMDKREMARLAYKKLPHLNYMHLAGNVTMMNGLVISAEDEQIYSHDVSMVGSLYYRDSSQVMAELEDEIIEEELRAFVNDPIGDWRNEVKIYDRLSDAAVNRLVEIKSDARKRFDMDNRYFYETILTRDITHRERVLILSELAKRYDVHLYTTSKENIPDKVHVHGQVDPGTEAPKVYHLSKINLNITLRSIETGIPMRVFDVMSVGGFMLSNYQEELEELFIPDKEIVLFRTLGECIAKVDYYLKHERERRAIAIAGYEKIKKHYNYPQVLQKIISIVDESISRDKAFVNQDDFEKESDLDKKGRDYKGINNSGIGNKVTKNTRSKQDFNREGITGWE
ncbi:MAG: glycosyltransferase [Lachnospiraceae bacterium]|jgi:spore maturation protein CgeB|nr:glycosyltransferase [Lachnospiraceae bacterium]